MRDKIFSGEDVVVTMPCIEFSNYKYHHQDGRELEYYRNNFGIDSYIPEFRIKGSNEIDRKELVQKLIDDKNDYQAYLRLRDKFEPILKKITKYTKAEFEELQS